MMKKTIFALLSLLSISFATSFLPEFAWEGVGLIVSAFALVMAILAITYMFAKLISGISSLSEIRLQTWARAEAFNLGISAVLILGIIVTLGIVSTALNETFDQDPFETSYEYLNDLSTGKGIQTAENLLQSSYRDQLTATKHFFMSGVGIWGGAGKDFRADYLSRSAHKDMLMNFALMGVVSLEIQKLFLQFIQNATLSILLPIAIVLRIIPFSRQAGNFLIAISIGFLIIFPLTYVLYSEIELEIPDYTHIEDHVLSQDFNTVGRIMPQSIFLPNLSLVILSMSVIAIMNALKGLPTR